MLEDIGAPGQTVVTEVVDPGCMGPISSQYRAVLQQARSMFDALGRERLTGQVVRLRGVGFYDFNHNQTGRSRSCIDLHPVIAIERVG